MIDPDIREKLEQFQKKADQTAKDAAQLNETIAAARGASADKRVERSDLLAAVEQAIVRAAKSGMADSVLQLAQAREIIGRG